MRVTTSKSKNSESFYITRGYINDQGISTSSVVRKLGTLKELLIEHGPTRDDVMAWAKEEARFETLKYKEGQKKKSVPITFHTDRPLTYGRQMFFRGGYLFLQSIYYRLQLNKTCLKLKTKYRLKYDINALLLALVCARLLEPDSRRSSFQTASSFLAETSYKPQDISHALNILGSEYDFIQSEACKNSLAICRHNNKTLYYDSSYYYFETAQTNGPQKSGECKEHKPGVMIQMRLFMNGRGMPLALSLLSGNANSRTPLSSATEELLREFNCQNFIYCVDEKTEHIPAFHHTKNRSYILTLPLRKLPAEDKAWALDQNGFKRVSDDKPVDLAKLPDTDANIYYKEKLSANRKLAQRLIVTYSPRYALYQKTVRHEADLHKNDIKKLTTKETYDGLYAVCTDLLEDKISSILKVSERRWQTEEFFRIMKNDFTINPLYLKDENRIQAHFLICFLGLMLYRVLETKLGRTYSPDEILMTLNAMNFAKIAEQGFIPLYPRNKITDALHDICGFRTDYEFLTKSQVKTIQKKSKGQEIE